MSIANIAFLTLVVVVFGGLAISLLGVYIYTEAWKETPSGSAEPAPSLDSEDTAPHELPRAA
jgi:hypothetical protein